MLEISNETLFAFTMLALLVGVSFFPDSFWFHFYNDQKGFMMTDIFLTYILPVCVYLFFIAQYISYKEKEDNKLEYK